MPSKVAARLSSAGLDARDAWWACSPCLPFQNVVWQQRGPTAVKSALLLVVDGYPAHATAATHNHVHIGGTAAAMRSAYVSVLCITFVPRRLESIGNDVAIGQRSHNHMVLLRNLIGGAGCRRLLNANIPKPTLFIVS